MNRWSNTFLVGPYKCHMTYSEGDGELRCEWDPEMPDRNLSEQELAQYRRGRDSLFDEIAKELGGNVVVVETG